MGTWGPKPFENDDAADFVDEFGEMGADAIVDAIRTVTSGSEDYLEGPEAQRAIAACAFVAAAIGDSSALDEVAADAWQGFDGETATLASLKPEAVSALDRIMSGNSELLELWEEADAEALEQFKNEIEALKKRL
ncbi:DUF4259 domain-containing protein [Oricola sp.]|uniref:DUF4259 domain-containing protein n=1 Tax=Oricola sp. TaxID=1979950 RepID=UPI0025DB5A6E|nr:DUF4259 domain-containing protein [Oricola sp.]MCI5078200.1 DUF4259 domain-containing protein [Oricola sp.]